MASWKREVESFGDSDRPIYPCHLPHHWNFRPPLPLVCFCDFLVRGALPCALRWFIRQFEILLSSCINQSLDLIYNAFGSSGVIFLLIVHTWQ